MRIQPLLANLAVLTALSAVVAPPAAADTVDTFATLPSVFEDISVGPDGSLYVVSNPSGGVTYHVDLDGTQTTTATGLQFPLGGVVDAAGNYYVSCWSANHIHLIEPDGTTSVFLGSVNAPTGLVLTPDEQTMYAALYNLGRVIRIDMATKSRTIIANGPSLFGPDGLALDEAGNVYSASFLNSLITKVDTTGAESVLVTLPGSQTGYIDYRDGFLYVAGIDTHKIYRVSVADGSYTTLAGTGVAGTTDGPAETAQISSPNGLALSPDGQTLWFQSQDNLRRVLLNSATPVVETVSTPASSIALAPTAPNPFRHDTRVQFTLPTPAQVNVSVYDSAGRLVRDLTSGSRSAGAHQLRWDGRADSGRPVGSGVYHVRVQAGAESRTQRVVRVR